MDSLRNPQLLFSNLGHVRDAPCIAVRLALRKGTLGVWGAHGGGGRVLAYACLDSNLYT